MRGTSFWLRRRDASEPIEYRADSPLHRRRIVAVKPVEVAATDEPVGVGFADLNGAAAEAALATVAEPDHAECTGSGAAPP